MVKDLIRYKAYVKLKKGVNIHNRPYSPIGLSSRNGRLPTGQRDTLKIHLSYPALSSAVQEFPQREPIGRFLRRTVSES